MIRKRLVTVLIAASIAILATGALAPGHAGARPAELTQQGQPPPSAARPGVIGAGLNIRMSPAQATSAARRCSAWASQAGFANNGRHGHLVVAVAIGMAESGCDPLACFDDTARTICRPSSSRGPRDSIDRGVWQINSRYWKNVSDRCAFSGPCNARSAYNLVSDDGTYFRPWTTYLAGTYKRYLPTALAAVRALRAGAVTSGRIGWCAAYPADRPGARVRLARCGSAIRAEFWTRSGGPLRTRGGLCMGARFRHSGPVTLQRCSYRGRQQWQARPGFTLFDKGARRCLTIPRRSSAAGQALTLEACRQPEIQAWYLP